MSLILVGINHKTADISLREKVAFPPETLSDALREVISLTDISEVVILSTCNRTELYIEGIKNERPNDELDHSAQKTLINKKLSLNNKIY